MVTKVRINPQKPSDYPHFLYICTVKQKQQLILCIGSNHEPQRHVAMVRQLLERHMAGLVFSPSIWTEPVGVVSPPYLNCLAYGETTLSYDQLHVLTKQIEQQMGRTPEKKHKGEIPIDIDILQLGGVRYHLTDWTRQYVIQLLPWLEEVTRADGNLPK